MYSAIISAWYMYGSTNELQVISPSTSSLPMPASSSASFAAFTYNCVALRCGTTPTSVSAAPTMAAFPRNDGMALSRSMKRVSVLDQDERATGDGIRRPSQK